MTAPCRWLGVALLVLVVPGGARAKPHAATLAADKPVRAEKRTKIEAPARPLISDVKELEYDSLPLMKPVPLDRAPEASIRIAPIPIPQGAEEMMPPGWHISSRSPSSFTRIGDLILPNDRTTVPAWSAGILVKGRAAAESFVVMPGTLRADGFIVTRYEGTLDDGVEKAKSAEAVRAAPIVPRKLYAFRRCVGGCDRALGDPERTESIALVARDALWAGTTDPSPHLLEVGTPTFFFTSAEIKPGSSATLLLEVASDRPEVAAVSYQLDVVWPSDGGPQMTLFEGTLKGPVEKVVGPSFR